MAASNSTAPSPDSSSQSPPSPTAPPPAKNSSSSSSAPPPDSSTPPPSPPPLPPPSPPPPPPPSPPPPSPNPPPPESHPSDGDDEGKSPPTSSDEDNGSSESPPSKKPPPPPPPRNRKSDEDDDDSQPDPPPGRERKESPTGTVYSSARPKSLSQDSSPPSLAGSDDNGSSGKRHSSKGHAEGANLGLIVGTTVGVGLFLILMAVGLLICTWKKRRARAPRGYYDHPGGGKGGGYYDGGSFQTWQSGPQGMAAPQSGGGGGWYQAGPPPMMMMMSGERSSGAFSGSLGASLPPPPPSPGISLGYNQSTFSYEELAEATDGFSQGNLVGQGGFGYVFKGMLPGGKEVAIKQLKAGSGQGESEFRAEIEIITRVHHRYLVSLVGYCIEGQQRLLVYEYVPNQTLEYHLHGKGLPVMDWPTRVKIALGSAKGLAYLHEDCHPRVIHRDIKASNILLDNNFEARVADFGLARPNSDTNTHVSTRVMGTFGYLAPEYASTGKLTEKSDVFSFGVMLLELITGRRPIDLTNMMEDCLVDWARPLLSEALADENYDELVDHRLENNYNVREMTRMAASAAACVRHSARKRPKMSQIVRALESDVSLEDLYDGKRPGQTLAFGSSDESGSYSAKMREFKKLAMESDDFSSQDGGHTRELL